MHELSLCESIYEIVDRTAAGRTVTMIHLEVGQLRQVVPDTLTYCWTVVSDQTTLAGSQLVVHTVPVTLRCLDCGSTTTLTDELLLLCTKCEGADVSVTAGEEFMLTSLELAEA
ncbi:MAG TPA: hydrogenase maturation nickel metallochaperone HypA [Dermatophilaceae bacterium]